MCAERRDIQGTVQAVADELLDLMRRKRRELIDLSLCHEIARTPVVATEAARQGLSLDTAGAVMNALKSILKALEAEERKAATSGDVLFARPAMELLGLTPGTANKGVGERQKLAASSRGVSPSTMRRHEKDVAQELAAYLCTSPPQPGALPPSPPEAVAAAAQALNELRSRRYHVYEEFPSLPAKELPVLAAALADTYKGFSIEFEHLVERAMDKGWPGLMPEEDAEPYELRPLRALAERGFNDGYLEICLRDQVQGERSLAANERVQLLAGLLQAIDWYLPPFSEREEEFLEYVAQEACGNWYRFLVLLEAEELGRKVVGNWREWLYRNPHDRFQLPLEINEKNSSSILSKEALNAKLTLRRIEWLRGKRFLLGEAAALRSAAVQLKVWENEYERYCEQY